LPVARALVCAHELGIVHRDLKPENILLGEDGSVKVVDFGIAKWIVPQAGAEADDLSEGVAGTLPYMAPEQWLGDTLDARVDLWAFGVILHEMALGAHPLAPVSWTRLAEGRGAGLVGAAEKRAPGLSGTRRRVSGAEL